MYEQQFKRNKKDQNCGYDRLMTIKISILINTEVLVPFGFHHQIRDSTQYEEKQNYKKKKNILKE